MDIREIRPSATRSIQSRNPEQGSLLGAGRMILLTRTARAQSLLETIHFGSLILVLDIQGLRGRLRMNTQTTKLEGAEYDLKQLMADVTRAMQKAEEAVTRIIGNGAAVVAEAKSEDKKII
jgi:hypothetical protein